MNTVKYNHRMTEEEMFRYAYHRMLEVDKEDLYKMLMEIFWFGLDAGYDKAMIQQREDEPEVKFDPLP